MNFRRILAGLALATAATVPAAAQVQININTGSTNSNGYHVNRSSIGWYYTPSTTFFLLAINTRFNASAGTNVNRTVTAELWSNRPAIGGSLLASGNFQSNSALGVLGGGSFSPILLQAGVTYFIGFRNVQGLGVNWTGDPSAIFLGARYFSNGPVFIDDTYEKVASGEVAPIIQLVGRQTSVVPEPMSMTLLATGLVGMGAVGYFKRRKDRSTV
jgi:hypothetical protein